jgi:hypothetical protein
VEARLHKLLVYGPGQFFKPHQDTEKHPGMVATLVLVWPCAHIGGELQVWQGDSVQLFSSQHLKAQALRWCAFYADCRHEVRPVAEGWRVVLTFDLMLPTHKAASAPAAHPALVQALSAVFLPGGSPRLEAWLLLLDHEYTEHGLRWPLLKGDDRPRVAALRSAADALGLVAQLALAEIHQSWTANVPYTGRGRGPAGDPEPDELIEEDLSLNFWVDAQGHSHKGKALSVNLADCVSFTEAHDAFLVNEEYEGYMGNYGETRGGRSLPLCHPTRGGLGRCLEAGTQGRPTRRAGATPAAGIARSDTLREVQGPRRAGALREVGGRAARRPGQRTVRTV